MPGLFLSLRSLNIQFAYSFIVHVLIAFSSRIFQFENFDRTKRRILKKKDDEGALVGYFITHWRIITSIHKYCPPLLSMLATLLH